MDKYEDEELVDGLIAEKDLRLFGFKLLLSEALNLKAPNAYQIIPVVVVLVVV